MVMKNRFDNIFSTTRIYDTDSAGNTTATLNRSLWQTRGLSSVVSNTGDFITPLAHQYSSRLAISWNGSEQTFYENSRKTYLVQGILSRTLVDSFPADFTLPAHVYNKAYSDLVEQIRGNVDLSIDLIQWRQAKQMLSIYARLKSGTVELINQSLRSIFLFNKRAAQRKDRLKRQRLSKFNTRRYDAWYNYNARKLALQLARARLEYVYGIKPLASTIVGLGELIAKPEKAAMYKVKGKGRHVHQYTVSFDSPTSQERRVNKVRYFCTLELYLKPQDRVLSNLSKISSLNPASIGWEAMPWSFVIDWVVDIGSWLRSVETATLYGSSFVFGRQSHGWKGTSDQSDVANSKNFRLSARAFAQKTVFVRTPLYSFPMPRMPLFELNLGASRALNGLALAAVNAKNVDDFIRSFAKR